MGNNSVDRNEVECRDILCSTLPVRLLFVLGLVCTVMLVVDEVEPGALVSDKSSRAHWMRTNIGKASAGIIRE